MSQTYGKCQILQWTRIIYQFSAEKTEHLKCFNFIYAKTRDAASVKLLIFNCSVFQKCLTFLITHLTRRASNSVHIPKLYTIWSGCALASTNLLKFNSTPSNIVIALIVVRCEREFNAKRHFNFLAMTNYKVSSIIICIRLIGIMLKLSEKISVWHSGKCDSGGGDGGGGSSNIAIKRGKSVFFSHLF